jgi:signal transduction histidine kinase/AraC-like DNA-binding protein/ABC-type sugar transport system substrate-binding protein
MRIGMHTFSGDPFWVQISEAIVHRLGEGAIFVDLPPHLNGLSDEELGALADELLTQELDVLISDVLPDALFLRLLSRGLPIICVNEIDLTHPLLVSLGGWYNAGYVAMQYIAERLAGRGRVLCVSGRVGNDTEAAADRLAAVETIAAQHPALHIKYLSVSWSYAEALAALETHLAPEDARAPGAHPRPADTPPAPPFDAIFGLSDPLALAARDACRKLGLLPVTPTPADDADEDGPVRHDAIPIVGINGDPLALAAIAEGSFTATVDMPAADFAERVVDLAHRAGRGEPLPPHFELTPRLVTRANLAEVSLRKLIAMASLPTRLVGVDREAEQRRLRQSEINAAIHRQMGGILDREELARQATGLIRKYYGYDEVWLWLWPAVGSAAEEEAALLPYPPHTPGPRPKGETDDPAGVLAEALRVGRPVFVPDVRRSDRFAADPRFPDTRARVVLPLAVGQKRLGLLDLHSRQTGHPLHRDLAALAALADYLAIAIRNADLYAAARTSQAAAETANQLKTRLLANVSHELRAPMNVILGYTKVALGEPSPYGVELPAQLRADLGYVYQSGEHLVRLINDLLDLSRAEIGELDLFPEVIETRAFLVDVFNGFTGNGTTPPVAQPPPAWELDLPERLPIIQADPLRLRQILLNLLSNALKFTPAGRVTLGAALAPPHLHIWVRDTGPGIPTPQQEAIFQPFVTIERAGQRARGVGLGLSITRRLVALHGGALTLESRPGAGSTFHVYLPLPTLTGGRPAVDMPATGAAATRGTIMVISRDRLASLPPELAGEEALTVYPLDPDADPDVAAATLLTTARPNALLWDQSHATPQEWTLVQRLREHPQLGRLPFIVYAAVAGQQARGTGPTGLLTKPVAGQTLLDALAALAPAAAAAAHAPVLIVDDDPAARSLYARLVVQALGDRPICMAADGAAALDALAAQTPCLVILDLLMPKVDGFTVLARLRAGRRTRHTPVIVLSGKLLLPEDIRRLDYAGVTFQTKGLLTDDEAAACLSRVLAPGTALPQATSILVKTALAYLHQNYTRPLAREDIAAAAGVNKSYLSRVFHAEVGIPLWEFLTRFRVAMAQDALTGRNDPIIEVAAQVGFDDPAYFSRVFSRYVGVSPQAYRKGQR